MSEGQPDQQPGRSGDDANSAWKGKPGPTGGKADQAAWHPEEKEHRRHERRYWRIQTWITVGGLVVSFLALGAAVAGGFVALAALKASQRQVRIAQDTYVAGARPWIKIVTMEPVALRSDDKVGIDFSVKFIVENVGHSPAQNVSVTGDLLIGDFDPPPDKAVVSVCKQVADEPLVRPGRVLFPDSPQPIEGDLPSEFLVASDKVWAARTARIKADIDSMPLYHNPRRAQEWAEVDSRFPFHAALSLVGCVNYRSSDNGILFQTSFRVDIGQQPNGGAFPLLGGERPVSPLPAITPSDPDVGRVTERRLQRDFLPDQIKLATPLYGSFAY